jgi:hypothetical protein
MVATAFAKISVEVTSILPWAGRRRPEPPAPSNASQALSTNYDCANGRVEISNDVTDIEAKRVERQDQASSHQPAGDRILDRREAFLITNESKKLVEHL